MTLVFPDQVIVPSDSGQQPLEYFIRGVIDYHMSGKQSRDLPQHMIDRQRMLVDSGRVIGENAPYGFAHALLDSQNKILEILPRGKRVRQRDCHVAGIPDAEHPERLQAWITILCLKEQGWGFKRIAKYLNVVQKIPSPNAGLTRRNHGRAEIVKGFWSSTTVKSLLENRTILAYSGLESKVVNVDDAARWNAPEGGVSCTMVNRGDRRWTFFNEPGEASSFLRALSQRIDFTAAMFADRSTACAIRSATYDARTLLCHVQVGTADSTGQNTNANFTGFRLRCVDLE